MPRKGFRPGDQSVQVQLEGAGEEVGDDVVAAVDALGVRAPGRRSGWSWAPCS